MHSHTHTYSHSPIHPRTHFSIEFYDELSKLESSVDTEGGDTDIEESPTQPMPDFAVKVLQLSGLTVEVGSYQLSNIRMDQSLDGECMIIVSAWRL